MMAALSSVPAIVATKSMSDDDIPTHTISSVLVVVLVVIATDPFFSFFRLQLLGKIDFHISLLL